ncbi:hypothetical protein EC991_008138 [Linnemannia zychae]|nr:hypothetical protein EC991_008138 [Linnemannia zychae]
MADIRRTIFNLVASIASAASRARVNKMACLQLSLQCNEVLRRFENGELGPITGLKLQELVATLESCRNYLTMFTAYGGLLRLIRSAVIPDSFEQHSEALKQWTTSAPQEIPDAVLDEEDRQAELFEEGTSRRQKRPAPILDINPDDLDVRGEVGKFPFGTIHMGIYNREVVYVRKVYPHIIGVPLSVIMDSVRLSGCLADCHNVIRVHGICKGRMIVTATTAHGPLSDYRIKSTLQKVKVAWKVADAIMALHDVDVDGGRKGIVLRDIRAENILIDKSKDGTEELEPRITGFEMCKRDDQATGELPDFDECYRRWWAPERTVFGAKFGAHSGSDVYSFGILMYEISTGREPEDGDLVDMEGMGISEGYTNLMKRCLNVRLSPRPHMDEVSKELLSIESMLMRAEREP